MDGKVLQDAVIAPNDNWSAVLTPRQTLRIVDLESKQAVDFLCYNADDVAAHDGEGRDTRDRARTQELE
jgi:uncharacterized protein YcgI (DUF1989 family)